MAPFGQQSGQHSPNFEQRYAAEVLTAAEVAALIGACSRKAPTGVRNRALLTLMYWSGLRVSEALSLRLAGIDTTRRTLRLLETKSGQPQTRHYYAQADDALARWLDTRRALGIRSTRVFCTLDGTPMSVEYVRALLKRLARKAGIDRRVVPHMLRHTFADMLRANRVDVVTISKLLGHSSVAVTARYLDHLTNAQAGEALAAADLPPLPGDEAEPPEPPEVPAWVFAAASQGARAEAIAEAAGISPAVIRQALEAAGIPPT